MSGQAMAQVARVLAFPAALPALVVAEVPAKISTLLEDYRLGLDARVDGLTRAEFARAWKARYSAISAAPMQQLDAAIEAGAVVRVCGRTCAVTMGFQPAYAMRTR